MFCKNVWREGKSQQNVVYSVNVLSILLNFVVSFKWRDEKNISMRRPPEYLNLQLKYLRADDITDFDLKSALSKGISDYQNLYFL